MANEIKIKYVNRSMCTEVPKVYFFMQDMSPTFDALSKDETGIAVDLYRDNKLMMDKNIVAFDQKATFVLHPKLYWGLASEIQESGHTSSAVSNSNSFFELNLEGVTEITVALYGNAEDGYRFVIENQC